MNTCTTTNSYNLDINKMLTIMRELKTKGQFLDAIRDVNFEDLRAQGFYIKAERDGLGEYWVVDDRIFKQVRECCVAATPKLLNGLPNSNKLLGIRLVPLSLHEIEI